MRSRHSDVESWHCERRSHVDGAPVDHHFSRPTCQTRQWKHGSRHAVAQRRPRTRHPCNFAPQRNNAQADMMIFLASKWARYRNVSMLIFTFAPRASRLRKLRLPLLETCLLWQPMETSCHAGALMTVDDPDETAKLKKSLQSMSKTLVPVTLDRGSAAYAERRAVSSLGLVLADFSSRSISDGAQEPRKETRSRISAEQVASGCRAQPTRIAATFSTQRFHICSS